MANMSRGRKLGIKKRGPKIATPADGSPNGIRRGPRPGTPGSAGRSRTFTKGPGGGRLVGPITSSSRPTFGSNGGTGNGTTRSRPIKPGGIIDHPSAPTASRSPKPGVGGGIAQPAVRSSVPVQSTSGRYAGPTPKPPANPGKSAGHRPPNITGREGGTSNGLGRAFGKKRG